MDNKILAWIIIGLGAFVFAILIETERRKLLHKYWSRSCTGTEWLKTFPQCSKYNIRYFLSDFTESFGFRKKDLLKFGPNDKIMDIYKALYPAKGMPDALELETFYGILEREYGLDVSTITPDITLGELFGMVIKNN